MDNLIVFASDLTRHDRVVLENLTADISHHVSPPQTPGICNGNGNGNGKLSDGEVFANGGGASRRINKVPNGNSRAYDAMDPDCGAGLVSQKPRRPVGAEPEVDDVNLLRALNDPTKANFEPTVFLSIDLQDLRPRLHPMVDRYLLQPYIRFAQKIVRNPKDVVMVTHLIIYFTTSIPSAAYLFWNFSYLHAFLHVAMQFYYIGTYTLMMHQHIHQRGILCKELAIFDRLFPYITDPLMGHTWNNYYYHHVKHHHVEGNGPGDLSSTIRYQRDSLVDFLQYLGRFYFFIWLELPIYFMRNRRFGMAAQSGFWELSNYAMFYTLATKTNWHATFFVFILPFLLLRVGLMVGNWGQHAFVDADEPESDYRSSVTLIDVASNRYCYNDGYHTSHHLNPLRHWGDHPVAFLQQKEVYSKESALVFHNIDYVMITVKLLQKDYLHLAKCLVPIGKQIGLTLDERVTLLKRHTRRFTEDEIRQKFRKS